MEQFDRTNFDVLLWLFYKIKIASRKFTDHFMDVLLLTYMKFVQKLYAINIIRYVKYM